MKKMEYKIDWDVEEGVCERCGKTKMLHTHKEKLNDNWNVTACANYCEDCIEIIDEQTDLINDYIDKINECILIITNEKGEIIC